MNRKQAAIALRKQGKTYAEIADALGTTKGVAWGLVNDARYTGTGARKKKLVPENFTAVWQFMPAADIHRTAAIAAAKTTAGEKISFDTVVDYLLNWVFCRPEQQAKALHNTALLQTAMLREGRRFILNWFGGKHKESSEQTAEL